MAELNSKINNNYNDAPTASESLIENKDTMYNCTECSSLIKILSINEDKNIIEFKCINKDCGVQKVISMNEYFEKMEKHKQKHINKDTCSEHSSNKYVSYCFDCNCHLCEECLNTREHISHYKNNIMEIKPIKEELNIIEEVIEDYKIKIENLKNEKINRIKELENSLNAKKINEDKKLQNKIELNEKKKSNEMKLNHDKYISDLKEIKKKYEKEIKERKKKYKKDKDKIYNKYKIMEEKEYIIHKLKSEELDKKYHDIINNLTYDKKIENMTNTKKINEIVYNTYNLYNDNYYNSININKILLTYLSDEHINSEIMKNILKDKYEKIKKIILKQNDEDNKSNQKRENIEKEIINEKNKIKEEYEKKLKDEKERFDDILKKLLKEKEDQFKKELEEREMKISYKYIILTYILYKSLYDKKNL